MDPDVRWQELPSAALAYILGIIPYKRADVKLVCQDWRTTVNESIKSLCLPDTELGALQHLTAVQHLTVKGPQQVAPARPQGPPALYSMAQKSMALKSIAQKSTARKPQRQQHNPWRNISPSRLQRLQSLIMSRCSPALLHLAAWQVGPQAQQQQQPAKGQLPSTSNDSSRGGSQSSSQAANTASGPVWRLELLESLSLHGMQHPIADALYLLLVGQTPPGRLQVGSGRAAWAAAPLQHLTQLQLEYCCFATNQQAVGSCLMDTMLAFGEAEGLLPPLQLLPALRDLDMTGCSLKDVPQAICGCIGLTRLKLASNLFEELPAEVSQLQKLQVLDLRNNLNFHSLGPAVSTLTNLTELNLSGGNSVFRWLSPQYCTQAWGEGRLGSLPASTDPAVQPLPGVYTLRGWEVAPHQQQLQALPELRHLQGLRVLSFSNNRDVLELPAAVSALTGLQELDARGCSLRFVTDEVWECRALKKLLLGDNVLAQMFDEISRLQDLEVLDLGRCRSLWMLPPELLSLPKLRQLVLSTKAVGQHVVEQLELRPDPVEVVFQREVWEEYDDDDSVEDEVELYWEDSD